MTFYCETMRSQVQHACPDHPNPFDCPDHLVLYSSRSRSYGLIIHDGGSSTLQIQFCPWCGCNLNFSAPPSLTNQ